MFRPRGLVPIADTARKPLPGARMVGPTEPEQPVAVSVILKPTQGVPGARPAPALDIPPHQRTYLSHEEFATGYGAGDADLATVQQFATGAGLTVEASHPARRTVALTGTAAQMSAAFGVRLQQYRLPDGRIYRGRTGPVRVPAALAGIVQSVLGLDDRPQARPHFQRLDELQQQIVVTRAAATPFTAVQVARLYDFPGRAAGLDGHGQCIGIIELGGGYREADLQAYFAGQGLTPPAITAVSVDGAGNQPGADADTEVVLDIEIAGAVAPGATIAVYFAPNTTRGFYDAITTAIHDQQNHPSVISISWGSPEGQPYWTTQAMQLYNQAFRDAATLGVTVCCASGDAGSSDGVGDGRPHVDFPAAAPFALGCGGTKLSASGQTISSEVVWNENPTSSATGGGVSAAFALPTWQARAHVPPVPGARRKTGRGVPDVAGNADPVTGYEIHVNGADVVVGGTSAVAPLWAGLIALLNQGLGKRAGYLNSVIYGTSFAAAFHDITSGNNGQYRAAAGWDACTGLGSPDGQKLLSALRGP